MALAERSPHRPAAIEITPSARRLTGSLRDIGYDFVSAIADVVDNSVAAGATGVDVDLSFAGARSWVRIADDGTGMSRGELNEALRFGTRRPYEHGELGKFGLGLKTASLSQCRRLVVATRASRQRAHIAVRALDLDHIDAFDRWEVLDLGRDSADSRLDVPLRRHPGTVVLWEQLDRVLTYSNPDGEWARRKLRTLAGRTSEYLGMVFHRFIEGTAAGRRVRIRVNRKRVPAWNPFAPDEPATLRLPPREVELEVGDFTAVVRFEPFVLPSRSAFSSTEEFERLSGPGKWNRQQGLYIYRSDRMIQSGGWCGYRAPDEHTKLARCALFFDGELDDLFQVNVAKMRVQLPAELRAALEKSVTELCGTAQGAYRSDRRPPNGRDSSAAPTVFSGGEEVGVALRMAALEAGCVSDLDQIAVVLRKRNPELASMLGW